MKRNERHSHDCEDDSVTWTCTFEMGLIGVK